MAAETAQALNQLASVRDPNKRHQLALGVTEMCVAQPLSESAEPVAGELLVTLTGLIGDETKVAMAEKLSICKWAPRDIIRHLAHEDIEIASIVIKKSKRLTDEDMVSIARDATPDHRRVLAGRQNLHLVVTNALAEPGEPLVLRALANNDTAEISENTLEVCLTVAKHHPKLREALARRHDLSTDYATQLCIMLPETWREELYRRFGLDKDHIEKLTINSALEVTSESEEDAAKRSVEEAEDAGKLNPEFVLISAKLGRDLVLDHAIAKLANVQVGHWRVALAMQGVRAAAMGCQAAGIDKTGYPVIHKALMRAGRMHQSLEGDAMTNAANVFRMYGAEKAAKVLRQMGHKA